MSEKVEQTTLFEEETTKGPVTCLGLSFNNDDERREYFRGELRKKLPELKTIEGFPVGKDEDIIALSDPPFYTACPNPWLDNILDEYSKTGQCEKKMVINPEPFATDITEGRADSIYNAHSYHTKVPHKAIMHFILNYTNPGEVIFDGFCGTGMTGVAATLCGNKEEVQSLGYRVDDNNVIYKNIGDDERENWQPFSKLGSRKAILSDLSPIASFISYNYNSHFKSELLKQSRQLLDSYQNKYNWLYVTLRNDTEKNEDQMVNYLNKFQTIEELSSFIKKENNLFEKINYVIWSDIFSCPSCNHEFNFWNVSVGEEMKMEETFNCPSCRVELSKSKCNRTWETYYDEDTKETARRIKREPVLINYKIGNKAYTKKPDSFDIALIEKIKDLSIENWIPTNEVPNGDKTNEAIRMELNHAHKFYSRRNLLVIADLWEEAKSNRVLKLSLTSMLVKTGSLLHNVGLKNGKINLAGALPNAIYIPSILAERNIFELVKGKIDDIERANLQRLNQNNVVSCRSMSKDYFNSLENTLDYIFLDPPFGANLMYSELNWLWESWLGVRTDNKNEAIENKSQQKKLRDYQRIMTEAFQGAYKALKPGKWMTVEFSNPKATVWNSIQTSIQEAGFIVANVAALNKGQGTYNSQTNPTSVTQDLVISAYKPLKEDIKEITRNEGTPNSAWSYVKQYLARITYINIKNNRLNLILERTPRILFDKMVAYHVQNGLTVPLSSSEFQSGLTQKFKTIDGMVFLEEQYAKYIKKKSSIQDSVQMELFVLDENTAIEWIKHNLSIKPQTRQDIHPNFMREIQHIAKHELLPELDDLLEQNFLMYDGKEDVPSQIHGYLSSNYKDLRNLEKSDPRLKDKGKNRWYVPDPNKQADLEKLREKSLLREFESYKTEIEGNKKKLKQFRTEAIRTGFKKAWSEKDFETIVKVGERLPEKVIQEDDKLLMYFDQAQIRIGM